MGWPGDRGPSSATGVEEGPGSTGQGGGQHPPGVTRGISATENRPPPLSGAAVRVKRWCKRPPARRETVVARQTPPGARPDSERSRAVRPSSRVDRRRRSATASGDGWSPTVRREARTANRTRPMSQPIRTGPLTCGVLGSTAPAQSAECPQLVRVLCGSPRAMRSSSSPIRCPYVSQVSTADLWPSRRWMALIERPARISTEAK